MAHGSHARGAGLSIVREIHLIGCGVVRVSLVNLGRVLTKPEEGAVLRAARREQLEHLLCRSKLLLARQVRAQLLRRL
eukprot:4068550-Pleurochrysis_carterae.AAC.2